jgi:hypothetical protein
MIDIETEDVFPLAEVPDRLPICRGRKRVHKSCVYRWCQRGVRGVRLEFLCVGGTQCTSTQALQRFFDALTAERKREPVKARTSRQRKLAHEAANAELAREGW